MEQYQNNAYVGQQAPPVPGVKTINKEDIPANEFVQITGYITYNRICSQIQGKELEDNKIRAVQQKRLPPKGPYTTITLRDCTVLQKDPNAMTVFERYLVENLYVSKNPELAAKGYVNMFTAKNATKDLPKVGVRDANNHNQITGIILDKDLAQDLKVTVIVKSYRAKANNKMNYGLETVILEEPLRYNTFETPAQILAQLGVTFTPAPVQEQPRQDVQQPFEQAQRQAYAQQPVQTQNYAYNQAPAGQQVPPPTPQNAFVNQQYGPNVGYVQNVDPYQMQTPQVQPNMSGGFPTFTQAPVNSGVTQAPPANTGIIYDPKTRYN